MRSPYSALADLVDALDSPEKIKAYRERMAAIEKAGRTLKRARTYLAKSAYAAKFAPDVAAGLLYDMIDDVTRLVRAMPDEFFDDRDEDDFDNYELRWTVHAARNLLVALEARVGQGDTRRKIRKLEDTAGRTPEEAELYRRKAAEMRAELDGDHTAGTANHNVSLRAEREGRDGS